MSTSQNTGQFARVIVTDIGKDMIAKSQNGQTLKFTRVALGDGLLDDGEDPVKLTAVKNERISCPIASYKNIGNGQFEVQFRLSNQDVENGFWHREIGVMAQIDNGTEQLYAYTTADNKASFIYDKTTPVEERVVNITFVIGNAENIEVVINNSIVYITLKDFEAHDADASAHSAAIDKHNAATDAHKENLATKAEAEAGTNTSKFMSPARVMDAIKQYMLKFLMAAVFTGIVKLDEEKAIPDEGANDNSVPSTSWVNKAISLVINSEAFRQHIVVDYLDEQNGFIKLGDWFGNIILQWGAGGSAFVFTPKSYIICWEQANDSAYARVRLNYAVSFSSHTCWIAICW